MSYPRFLWLWVKDQWLRFRMAFLRSTFRKSNDGTLIYLADPEWVAGSQRLLRENAAAGDPAAIELLRLMGDLPPEE